MDCAWCVAESCWWRGTPEEVAVGREALFRDRCCGVGCNLFMILMVGPVASNVVKNHDNDTTPCYYF